MPSRIRQIYQTDLVFVGPTGANIATGSHTVPTAQYGNTGALNAGSGSLIAELYRVQSISWNAQKNLTDVNQFGELAAIDRIPLTPPTVSLNISYLLSNLINEYLMGFTVSKAGDTQEVSFISGILSNNTNPKNYFLKSVSEGADAIDNSSTSYNVIAVGNAFITSYTSQGAVGGFPTVTVALDALNIQSDAISSNAAGVPIPAINPTDGTAITGFWYNLPTGLTSINNATLAANNGLSALRPGDIQLALGLNVGDVFFDPSDLKIQSYNISFNLNTQDLSKLGSKYAYAKVPQFPVTCSMQVDAIVGDFVTGKLTEIVNNNFSFNPTVTIYSPGSTTNVIAKYKLTNAKLDTQSSDLNIGSNKSLSLTFNTQIGGPQSSNGLFASGIIQ